MTTMGKVLLDGEKLWAAGLEMMVVMIKESTLAVRRQERNSSLFKSDIF